MFKESVDERFTIWLNFRKNLEESKDPFMDVWNFWKNAPFIPYNSKIDPFYDRNWPTPWEIIADNKYDDFTKALMIGWSIKMTSKFKNEKVEILTLLDKTKPSYYNVVCINDSWIINYDDNGPTLKTNIPELFLLENLIELKSPR